MPTSAEPLPKPLDELGPPGRRDRALRGLAAAGYAARGLVYLFVGVIALLSVWSPREPEGPHEVIAHLLRAPFGKGVLTVLGVGLMAYSAWRLLQGAFDKDRRGRRPYAVMVRLGFLCGSLTYAGLAAYAWALVAGLSRREDGRLIDWTRHLLHDDVGRAAFGSFGGVVVAMGLAQATIAWTEGYRRRMAPTWPDRLVHRGIARFGLLAKAVSFWIFGTLVVHAAVTQETDRPHGLGAALAAVGDARHGAALLTVLASGLIAYALYCFLLARYRDARW